MGLAVGVGVCVGVRVGVSVGVGVRVLVGVGVRVGVGLVAPGVFVGGSPAIWSLVERGTGGSKLHPLSWHHVRIACPH